jgi:hypothetical protein
MEISKQIILERVRTLAGCTFTEPTKCCVRADTFATTAAVLNTMVAAAKKTYPDLCDEDITVYHFNSKPPWPGASPIGILFNPPEGQERIVHSGWNEVSEW